MTMSVNRPSYVRFGPPGGHSLAEISVAGGPGSTGGHTGDIVELGWLVSTDKYDDFDPHIFVFHWINGKPTCYDVDCVGWVQWSATYFPHQRIGFAVDRDVYVGWVFWQGNWWAWFDNQWLGYFPGSIWGGQFIKTNWIQWFGEVSSNNGLPPRTTMGNGLFGESEFAARMSTLCDVDANAWVCWIRNMQNTFSTNSRYYDAFRVGFGNMRYGGPGQP